MQCRRLYNQSLTDFQRSYYDNNFSVLEIRSPTANMTSSSYPNGLERIVPVKKTEVPWCPKRKTKVIAIDFGTSTLAVSYKTHTHGRVIDVPIEKSSNKSFIPTVLLIKSDSYVEIGELALLQYTRMDDDDTSDCLFFDRVKLELQNDEVHILFIL